MEKIRKKGYVRPVSICTVVRLESAICNSSAIQVGTRDGAHGIEDQKVNTDFASDNNFLTIEGAGWDRS